MRERILGRGSGGRGGGRPAFMAAFFLAAATGIAALLLSWKVLDGIPHVSDGISYAFQGRIFASGRLCLDPPALPSLFVQENILIDAERWCSKYPPGWPLLLSLGWMAKAPWIMNPLLLGLTVLGVFSLGSRLFDRRTGLLSALLFAVSPFALLMGSGFMAHVPAQAASVWCLAAIAAAVDVSNVKTRRRMLVTAGLLGGLAFLIRPYTAATLLWPAVAWCLWRLRRRLSLLRTAGLLAAGTAPFLAFLLTYQWTVFGGPFTGGYSLYNPTESLTGVGGEDSPLFLLFRHHLPWYLGELNRSLWGFPWPDLLLLLPLAWPAKDRSRDLLLVACAASLIAGYCFYYYTDIVYSGPRFVFESLAPLAVLSARGILTLAALLRRSVAILSHGISRSLVPASTAAALLCLVAFPLARRLPEQVELHEGWYHGVSAEPLRQAADGGVGQDALVLVSGYPSVYGPLLLENALSPERGGRIFLRDDPALEERISGVYPRREMWRLEVQLEPLPGLNPYSDRFGPRKSSLRRVR